MIEDKILVWRFNRGSKDALRYIYDKYKDNLLGLAVTLLRDRSIAEDVIHDVFVTFAGTLGTFQLTGTLKGYLSTCVANGARDKNRLRHEKNVDMNFVNTADSDSEGPMDCAIRREQSVRLNDVLAQLPYEQCEIIVLHLHQDMRFRDIAEALGLSINTVQSRYRYGISKLRSILNNTVTK